MSEYKAGDLIWGAAIKRMQIESFLNKLKMLLMSQGAQEDTIDKFINEIRPDVLKSKEEMS